MPMERDMHEILDDQRKLRAALHIAVNVMELVEFHSRGAGEYQRRLSYVHRISLDAIHRLQALIED